MLAAGFFAIFLFTLSVEGECTNGCDQPIKHYEEIGCTAVYAKPTDCCPAHFECNQFQGRALDKCYFKGKQYNSYDKVPETETAGNCLASCFCNKPDGRDDFVCAHIDCPEFFQPPPKEGCIRQYELNSCCATSTVCPPFDKLGTCVMEGKTYYEGQHMYPSNDSCQSCICKPGMDKPYCHEVTCAIELLHSDDIRQNCAPVYYGNDRCCPIQWQCASETDKIVPTEKPSDGDKKCKYGDKELHSGDKVTGSDPKVICECKIPPLVTCIHTPNDS